MNPNDFVLKRFYEIITPSKQRMFDRIAADRTRYLTVVLEDVFQEHNASAVLRTCDCFGIQDMHVISRRTAYNVQRDIALGAGRWVDVFHHGYESNSLTKCVEELKSKGYKLVATTPHTEDYKVQDIDLDVPLAIAFGTERQGISDELLELADAHVKIPMYGFTESFNLSVSAALVLQTLRQRLETSEIQWKLSMQEQTALKIQWCMKILNGGEALKARFLEEGF